MIREGTIKRCDEVLKTSIYAFSNLAERIEGTDSLLSLVKEKEMISYALIADIIMSEAQRDAALRAYLIELGILRF